MEKIRLPNRDGANLWLEKVKEIEPNISEWKLNVDDKHKYCLEYMRFIGNYPSEIQAIDPSGGPMLSIADELNDKYKIIKINSINSILISEKL